MSSSHLEPLLRAAERRAVLMVLRSHPEWTLEHLASLLAHDGDRAPVLRKLTLGELLDDPGPVARIDGGPPIDHARLQAAKRLRGPEFDQCVHEVIAEADGRPVAAKYLRARVGGPRWKLQGSLRRLIAAGRVQRSGTTSTTRYWIGVA
ncbi:MAG TPA: hypothetical protein VK034_18165 [Enhygromyxa sp.]|nr:hypothetical protein [Enhygromyxa sp.]